MAIESLKQKDNNGNETSFLKSLPGQTLYGSFHFKMTLILSNLVSFIYYNFGIQHIGKS